MDVETDVCSSENAYVLFYELSKPQSTDQRSSDEDENGEKENEVETPAANKDSKLQTPAVEALDVQKGKFIFIHIQNIF